MHCTAESTANLPGFPITRSFPGFPLRGGGRHMPTLSGKPTRRRCEIFRFVITRSFPGFPLRGGGGSHADIIQGKPGRLAVDPAVLTVPDCTHHSTKPDRLYGLFLTGLDFAGLDFKTSESSPVSNGAHKPDKGRGSDTGLHAERKQMPAGRGPPGTEIKNRPHPRPRGRQRFAPKMMGLDDV